MKALEETVQQQEKAGASGARPQARATEGRCGAPSPAQPLCSALQVIEKMERVLEDKLRERKEPLLNRLQGKPRVGEAAPLLFSPRGPAFLELPSSRSTVHSGQRVVLLYHSGSELFQRSCALPYPPRGPCRTQDSA